MAEVWTAGEEAEEVWTEEEVGGEEWIEGVEVVEDGEGWIEEEEERIVVGVE